MNRFTCIGLLAFIFFFTSCQNRTSDADQESSVEQEPEQANEENTMNEVLNINQIGAATLASVPGLSQDIADELTSKRPFLSIEELASALMNHLSEDQVSEVFQRVFLPLNLNTTPESTFKMIPGVGDKMAHEFDEYRPYTSIEQFRREIGKYVDETEVARYEQYVFVPIDLNTASDEDILAIPGVGDKMLHEFKEYRPYTSIEQFHREIGKYVDDDELARLERYVEIR